MELKKFSELNENLTKELKENGLSYEYINIDESKIKQYTFNDIFKLNNKWNIKNPSYERINQDNKYVLSNTNGIKTFKELCKSKTMELSTKENKLKEVRHYLNFQKQFKNSKILKLKELCNNKYFSLYDLKKVIQNNEVDINDIKEELKQSDKLILNVYGFNDEYEYKRTENKVQLLEFLYILKYDKLPIIKTIDNKPNNREIEPTEETFKENNINVKFFNEHIYYYVDKNNNDKVLNHFIDILEDYIKRSW